MVSVAVDACQVLVCYGVLEPRAWSMYRVVFVSLCDNAPWLVSMTVNWVWLNPCGDQLSSSVTVYDHVGPNLGPAVGLHVMKENKASNITSIHCSGTSPNNIHSQFHAVWNRNFSSTIRQHHHNYNTYFYCFFTEYKLENISLSKVERYVQIYEGCVHSFWSSEFAM